MELDSAGLIRYSGIVKEVPPGMLDEIVKRLVETLHPLEIYLFGSHASGTPHRHSDVDILVVVPDGAGDCRKLATCGDASLRGILVPVDIVVFHRSDMEKWVPVRLSLPGTVVRKGKQLYVATTGTGPSMAAESRA